LQSVVTTLDLGGGGLPLTDLDALDGIGLQDLADVRLLGSHVVQSDNDKPLAGATVLDKTASGKDVVAKVSVAPLGGDGLGLGGVGEALDGIDIGGGDLLGGDIGGGLVGGDLVGGLTETVGGLTGGLLR
jgi:hypothetical protein